MDNNPADQVSVIAVVAVELSVVEMEVVRDSPSVDLVDLDLERLDLLVMHMEVAHIGEDENSNPSYVSHVNVSYHVNEIFFLRHMMTSICHRESVCLRCGDVRRCTVVQTTVEGAAELDIAVL